MSTRYIRYEFFLTYPTAYKDCGHKSKTHRHSFEFLRYLRKIAGMQTDIGDGSNTKIRSKLCLRNINGDRKRPVITKLM